MISTPLLNAAAGQVSSLGIHILSVTCDETIPGESQKARITRITLYFFGGGLSFASCTVPVIVSWTYDAGKRKVLSGAATLGVGIDFGVFGTYGYVLLINSLARQLFASQEHQKLFGGDRSFSKKIAHVVASVIWGGAGRVQATGLSLLFNQGWRLGLLGSVGGAGPPIYSAFRTISRLTEAAKGKMAFQTVDEKALRSAKKDMQISLAQCKQAISSMSVEQRRAFLTETFAKGREQKTQIQNLFSHIRETGRLYRPCRESRVVSRSRSCTKFLGLVPPAMIMVQLWILTNKVFGDSWAEKTASSLAVSSYLLLIYNETQDMIHYCFDRIVGLFTPVHRERTETEVIFPRLSLLLDILGLGIALLPYAELVSIAEKCVEKEPLGRAEHDTFVYGSYLGWVMVIFQSVRRLLVANMARAYAQSRFGTDETREFVTLLRKVEQVEEILEEANSSSFAGLLNDLSEDLTENDNSNVELDTDNDNKFEAYNIPK